MNEPLEDRSQQPRRKRASKACLTCRARKVRCDVAHRGPPCMNCFLDKQECVVKARSTKYRVTKKHSVSEPLQLQKERSSAAYTPPEMSPTAFHAIHSPPSTQITSIRDILNNDRRPSQTGLVGEGASITDTSSDRSDSSSKQRAQGDIGAFAGSRDQEFAMVSNFSALEATHRGPDTEPYSILNTHVLFSYYPFLKLDSINKLSPHDVNFLEAQGCFRIPTRPFLDDFVREYFLHIHTILPFLNEGLFWKLYSEGETYRSRSSRISVFVFQTMLFAASTFVPLATIQKLGFKDIISARATYYRRAKLLFDFDAERDSISLSQGTLLMSYYTPLKRHKKSNTYWLGNAIHFAKDADAHRYQSKKGLAEERRNVLKRLWWCCILRDRILPLGIRTPLNISSEHFDFSSTPLTMEDLDSEITQSRVYDSTTKRSLNQLLVSLCELAVPLTDVIMLLYPASKSAVFTKVPDEESRETFDRIATCKNNLTRWFEKTTVECATPGHLGAVHESVVLYTNMLYIYYNSAMLALHHQEVLISATTYRQGFCDSTQILQSKKHLEEAVSSISEGLKEIVQLKLAKYMTISMVAYAALPLVLHLLDVKLATTAFQKATKQRRLNVYTEAMGILKSQYDVTDGVSEIIGKMIEHVSIEGEEAHFDPPTGNVDNDNYSNSSRTEDANTAIKDWGDVFLRQPTLYLRMTFTIDLSLSTGRFPEDKDFPVALQSRTKPSKQFPPYCISLADERSPSHVDSKDSKLYPNDQMGTAAQTHFEGLQADEMLRPINLDTMDFETQGFELPMGFEAFDMELLTQRGMEFDCPPAWADTSLPL